MAGDRAASPESVQSRASVRFFKHIRHAVRSAYEFVASKKGTCSQKALLSLEWAKPVDRLEAHSREALNDCIDYIHSCSSFGR